MEHRSPDRSDLLIDLSGIESVPFPQQLITAEMDDTFGLFGPTKLRSHSVPTSTGPDKTSQQAPDVFSPVMDQSSKYSQEEDSVFTNSPMITGTPVFSKSDRMLRSGPCDADTVSSELSRLGLNDAFVRSTNNSFVGSTISDESRGSANPNGISSIRYDRVSSIESSTSSGGGISAITADDYRLADMDDTSESIMPLMKQTPQVESDPCNIISQVLDRRKSVGKRSVDDDIARKIQEMFDAASPTKNPDFYSRSFRHSLTPARNAPTREPFSYATPRRIPASSLSFNSSAGSNITPIPIAGNQNPYVMNTTYPDKVQKQQMEIANNSFTVSDPIASGILKNLNNDVPERLPTPKRLSFSTSSSSEQDFDSAPPVKGGSDSKNFAKPVGYSLPRLRQPHAVAKSGQQPFKAVHHAVPKVIEPVDPKLTKHYGTVSAPVRRKFAPPMAASSPIATLARNKNKELKSSGYGRPSPAYKTAQASSASGAGHGVFKLPASGRGMKPSAGPLGPPPAPNRRNSTGTGRRSYTSAIQPPEIKAQLPPSSVSRRSLMKENTPEGYRY